MSGAKVQVQRRAIAAIIWITTSLPMGCAFSATLDRREFADPPANYRPIVTIDEGSGYVASLAETTKRAVKELDAGAILFNPQGDPARKKPLDIASIATLPLGLLDQYPSTATPWLPKALPGEVRFGSYLADGKTGPGKPPSLGYMTPEWFSAIRAVLEATRDAHLNATYYDDVGFPSGSADGTVPERYNRKLLRREEVTVSSGQPYTRDLTIGAPPLAVVALNSASGERINLLQFAKDGRINWTAPFGNWRVQCFQITTASARPLSPDYYGTVDYLDPEASRWFIENSYDRVYGGLSEYFGSTIDTTFFDDVGIFPDEKTWNNAIAARFERNTGKAADLYYPALWEDIGSDTAAARVGFFKARAELLGETFPKLITDWDHAHGVKSTGHAPGNYNLQPTDTVGDPFKFYAYTDVPMADVVWGYGFARDGFKLISSVAAQRDVPITAAEAFSVDNDANGYRRLIDLFVRGFNEFVIGGRQPSKPLGTPAELSQWAGRSSFLLRGGRHVADIAVVFPIDSLQAFYSFNAVNNTSGLPSGVYAYRDADYQAVGEMLFSSLRRDFTFIHPDALAGDKIQVHGSRLDMVNKENRETYRAVVLPGGDVISVPALAKIKSFWDAGGIVIATSLLPSRSAEFGRDAEVKQLIAAMFGESNTSAGEPAIHRNAAGGQSAFLPQPSVSQFEMILNRLKLSPDVGFPEGQPITSGNGGFGYIHRERSGEDVFYFGNSSDTFVRTAVTLRGCFPHLEQWNPHDGTVTEARGSQCRARDGGPITEFNLAVPPTSSVAIIGNKKQ